MGCLQRQQWGYWWVNFMVANRWPLSLKCLAMTLLALVGGQTSGESRLFGHTAMVVHRDDDRGSPDSG